MPWKCTNHVQYRYTTPKRCFNEMEILKFPLKNKTERLTEETFLRLNRSCQRGLGVWPEDSFRKVFPITIFCLTTYFLTSVSQVQFVYTHHSDYKELLILITPAGSYFVSLVKVVSLMTKRKAVREIFNFFKKDWINGCFRHRINLVLSSVLINWLFFLVVETNKENIEVIYEFSRLSHMYGAFLYVTISSTWVAFMILSTIFNLHSLIVGSYARTLPFPSE